MVNEIGIKILQYIDANGGTVLKEALNTDIDPRATMRIASLCFGAYPNCTVNVIEKTISITEKGLRTLRDAGITPTTTVAPIVKRDQRSALTSVVSIKIDRNDGVKVTCVLSPSFIVFLKNAGTQRNVVEHKGASFARNWDCNAETKYTEVNLQELDQNFSSTSNIISEYGINTFILKLASSNGGTWVVTYKGLVSKEKLIMYAQALRDRAKSFYYSYVKPVKIEVSMNVVE